MSTALRLRKLADKSGPEPAPGESWPLLGVMLMDKPPKTHELSTTIVNAGITEGWIEPVGGQLVSDPKLGLVWETDTLLELKLVDGPIYYRVTERPGVHADENEAVGELGFRYRISNGYQVKLEGSK